MAHDGVPVPVTRTLVTVTVGHSPTVIRPRPPACGHPPVVTRQWSL